MLVSREKECGSYRMEVVIKKKLRWLDLEMK
jgi:hypothetical protein